MSPPDTNVETQKERHKPALLGMRAVVIFALVLLVAFLLFVFSKGGEQDVAETPPTAAEVQSTVEEAAD